MSSLPAASQRDEATRIIGLQTQFSADLIGLPIVDPQLTWQITSERPDAVQLAYEISSVGEMGDVITSAATSVSVPRSAPSIMAVRSTPAWA